MSSEFFPSTIGDGEFSSPPAASGPPVAATAQLVVVTSPPIGARSSGFNVGTAEFLFDTPIGLPAGGNPWIVDPGSTVDLAAINIAEAINSYFDQRSEVPNDPQCTAVAVDATIDLTAKTPGAAGNAIVLSENELHLVITRPFSGGSD